jgi:hypothetical protein
MDEHNIALMFGPNIFRSHGNSIMEMKHLSTKVDLCKIMMVDYNTIFVDQADIEADIQGTSMSQSSKHKLGSSQGSNKMDVSIE